MRAALVVMGAELVELALEVGGAGCWWSGREPALEGLVEPLGLSLGLGVSWGAVLLPDAE